MTEPNATIMIVGDVFVSRADPASTFANVVADFRRSDFLFGNLEGVVADEGTPWPKGEINVWKADARQIQAVEAARFDAMATTNNHIMDFGHQGLSATLGNLDRTGIRHAGSGRNFTEAHAPAIVEKKGVRIALLAYTSVFVRGWEATDDRPGLSVIRVRTAYEPTFRVLEVPGEPPKIRTLAHEQDLAQLQCDIEAARQQADLVICSFHWGISGGYEKLADYQPQVGRHAIDCGADLVFGHHPHLLQGIEIYRGRPIYYSLGNFTFARHNPAKGQELESLIACCTVKGGRLDKIGFLAATCDETLSPFVVTGAEAEPVLERVRKRSTAFGTEFVPDGRGFHVMTA